MCEQNQCCGNVFGKEQVTNEYSYTAELEKQVNWLTTTVKLKDEELSCKCEIIAELESMIMSIYEQHIEGGSQKAILDMGLRISDIMNKYVKA